MKFDWDAAKATANVRKHRVSFEEAETTVRNVWSITVDDLSHSDVDKREKTIGISRRGRVIVVIHTKPSENSIRIISARKATRQEVSDYEKEIRQRFEAQ